MRVFNWSEKELVTSFEAKVSSTQCLVRLSKYLHFWNAAHHHGRKLGEVCYGLLDEYKNLHIILNYFHFYEKIKYYDAETYPINVDHFRKWLDPSTKFCSYLCYRILKENKEVFYTPYVRFLTIE